MWKLSTTGTSIIYDNDWDRHPPDRAYYDENMANKMIEKNMVVMMINGDGDDDEDAADDDGWCILIFLVPNVECVMSRYFFFYQNSLGHQSKR